MHDFLNKHTPEIMHCDLNAAFASATQQQWEFLRGKPVGVTPVKVPGGAIISPSYELKAYGVKVGTRNFEAMRDVPGLVLVQSNAPLYKEVHVRFVNIFLDYSPDVVAKSIDEVVIDFTGTPIRKRKSMEEIAIEIKRRVKEEVGDSMRINVGIGTNRFTAKLAAGLHKPDGMDRIDHTNLRSTYEKLNLLDLPGINTGYSSRLAAAGITTPAAFLDADPFVLKNEVFQAITGIYWHQKLRGWEVDDAVFGRHGFDNSHVLPVKTPFRSDIRQTVYKLTHKVSTRMRKEMYGCRGVALYVGLREGRGIYGRITLERPLIATREIFPLMASILDAEGDFDKVRRRLKSGKSVTDFCLSSDAVQISVHLDYLVKNAHLQQIMLDDETVKARKLSSAEDLINLRYGLYTIGSPLLIGIEGHVPDRIPFGSPRDVEALYEDERQKRELANYGDASPYFDDWIPGFI